MPATIVRAEEREPLNVLGMPLRFLCDSRETGGNWSLFEEQVPLGLGPPPHHHDWDEAYYVLAGKVDFHIDGQLATIAAGDFAYLPANTVHAFKGASKSPARVLIFAAPAHASDFFEELHSEVRELPDDLAKVPGIGRRHGIKFMPAG